MNKEDLYIDLALQSSNREEQRRLLEVVDSRKAVSTASKSQKQWAGYIKYHPGIVRYAHSLSALSLDIRHVWRNTWFSVQRSDLQISEGEEGVMDSTPILCTSRLSHR